MNLRFLNRIVLLLAFLSSGVERVIAGQPADAPQVRVGHEDGLLPSRPANALRDAAFDRCVDFSLIRTALVSQDAGLLVDVALQAADAERILGRDHPAVTADQLFTLAIRFAVACDDETSLDRLTRYGQAHVGSALIGQIESARRLAGRSRDAGTDGRVSVLDMSPEDYAKYRSLAREIRLAAVLGDTAMLDDVERGLAAASSLSAEHVGRLGRQLGEARAAAPSPDDGRTPSDETLALLMSDGRCTRCQFLLADRPHVEMDVLVGGTPLSTVNHQGKVYLPIPGFGVEYQIRVRNRGPQRILAIASVDGLSVMNGQPVTESSSGYVIPGYGAYTVRGWRRGQNHVAAFTFEPRGQSYAAQTGQGAGIGVIRLRAIAEQPVIAPYSINGGSSDWWGNAIGASGLRSPVPAPSAGTGYGREVDSRVSYVSFRRSPHRQDIHCYYDTPQSLSQAGVPLPDFTPPPASVAHPITLQKLAAPSRNRSIYGRWRSGGRLVDFDPSGWMEIRAANGNTATFQYDIDDTTGNPDLWIITGTDKTGYRSRGIIQWIDDDTLVWRGDIGALTYRRVP